MNKIDPATIENLNSLLHGKEDTEFKVKSVDDKIYKSDATNVAPYIVPKNYIDNE